MRDHATIGVIHGGVLRREKSDAISGSGTRRRGGGKDQQYSGVWLLPHLALHGSGTEERY